jgi:dephospho-CoA kinase
MKKALILIVGWPGSGKSFAASVIQKHFGAKVFENGDIIREEVRRRGLQNTPENDKKVRLWFHEGKEHLIAKRMWKKIRGVKGVVVVVGVRTLKENYMLKKWYRGKFVIVRLESSFKIRAERAKKRGRMGNETLRYARSRDRSEMGDLRGQKRLLDMADYAVDNSKNTKKQTERKVVALMKLILSETT